MSSEITGKIPGHQASDNPRRPREIWEAPYIVSAAIRDTEKLHYPSEADPNPVNGGGVFS